MSWEALFGDSAPVLAPSAVESARFGLDVERLLVPDASTIATDEIVGLVAPSAADVVVLRYPASRIDVFGALLRTGRHVLFADQLAYWRLPTGTGRTPSPRADLTVDGVGTGDVDALVDDLVADIFAGYGNHYLADPVFDPGLALAGYQEWARTSAAAGGGLVLRRDGIPVALATTGSEGDHVEIELAGVLAAEQGRGLYPHLLAGVEERAAGSGAVAVVISTQAHNTGVQRAWARYGFEPVATFTTVHVLRPGLLSG